MKKTLLLLVPLLFFIGCEDNDSDEREDHYEDHDEDYDRDYDDYIELESFSYLSNTTWYSYVVVGYEPPENHNVNRECQWLRLYREYERCECKVADNLDGTGGTVFVRDLDGISYEYVEMVGDSLGS